MSLMNDCLKLMNIKLQLNNLNIQFDKFITQLQNNLVSNIEMQIEDISLKILNLGIEMLNVEIQSNNVNFFNSVQQIKNTGDILQNLALQMTNINSMKMNNFNIGIPLPNVIPINIIPINNPNYMHINFQTPKGYLGFSFIYGTTVKEAIEKFFSEFGKEVPVNRNDWNFIYNASSINKDCMDKIEDFFKNATHVSVIAFKRGI